MSRRLGWRTFIVVVVVGGAVAMTACSMSTDVVDRLTIVNRTAFDVEVQLSDAEKQSWQILGRAGHESSTVNELIADEGPTWVFRFHYGGELVDELAVKRSKLVRDGWRVEVPQRIDEKMRRLGFEPPSDR